ncbi:MAG: hypothetical protein ABFD79_12815 [Phycisphaerales bacterium]
MKRIRFYQLAIILSVLMSVNALAAEEKRPAALGAPAEEAAPATVTPAIAESNVAVENKFPFLGEVTAADLNARSGPGTNFYSCGKIGMPTRVIVVGEKFSWSQILPTPGSFSWIFKQYVQVDSNKPEIGIVNSDNVRVYAGADDRDAMISDSVQTTLNKNQKVRLIGQPVGDYYKIAPPEGASLWLSTQYIKFLRKADGIDMKAPIPAAEVKPAASYAKPNVVVDQVEPNNRFLEQYYVFTKQLEDEKAKPLADQNYVAIRAGLEALAADKSAGKASEYAQYTLKTVSRYELAQKSAGMVSNQKSALQKQLEAIEQERQEKKAKTVKANRFSLIGTFKPSAVYNDRPDIKRYLVMDERNMPISYAEPVGQAAGMELKSFYGKKVGLNGQLSTDAMSNFALIKFTEIQVIEDEEAEEAEASQSAQSDEPAEAEKPSEPSEDPNQPQE